MTTHRVAGILVPMLVPLDDAGLVDHSALGRHVDGLIAAGIDGLWVNGTSGEFPALEDDDRDAVVRTVVDRAAGRTTVVAHIGDTGTARAIRRARAAIAAGADLLSTVAPYYLALSSAELTRHLRLIAEAVGRPVVLYQHPATGQLPLPVDTIVELASEGTVAGLKESSRDLAYFKEIVAEAHETGVTLDCCVGASTLALASLEAGGAGVIPIMANVVPGACVALHDAFRADRRPEAAAAQARLDVLSSAIGAALAERTTWAATIGAYKWLLFEVGIFANARVHEPMVPLTETEQAYLRQVALPVLRELTRSPESV